MLKYSISYEDIELGISACIHNVRNKQTEDTLGRYIACVNYALCQSLVLACFLYHFACMHAATHDFV